MGLRVWSGVACLSAQAQQSQDLPGGPCYFLLKKVPGNVRGGSPGRRAEVMCEMKYLKHLYLLHPRQVQRLWEDASGLWSHLGSSQESLSLNGNSMLHSFSVGLEKRCPVGLSHWDKQEPESIVGISESAHMSTVSVVPCVQLHRLEECVLGLLRI